MSDIPIGSPPAPPGRHAAPQGWYPDPVDQSRERYWDGWSWSRNTRQQQHPGAYPPGVQQSGSHQPRPAQPNSGPYQQPPYPHRPDQQGPYQQGLYHPRTQVGAPALTADGVPIAGWGWRFLSGLLDLIIVTIVADIFSIPIFVKALPVFRQYLDATIAAAQSGWVAPQIPADLISGTGEILITVISLVVGMAYFGLFWRLKSATPAQLLCGLRIVPVDHGQATESLGWPTAFVRALVWWVPLAVSSVLLIFTIVNVLFPLGNVKRQAIHDLAARTQIVKIR